MCFAGTSEGHCHIYFSAMIKDKFVLTVISVSCRFTHFFSVCPGWVDTTDNNKNKTNSLISLGCASHNTPHHNIHISHPQACDGMSWRVEEH